MIFQGGPLDGREVSDDVGAGVHIECPVVRPDGPYQGYRDWEGEVRIVHRGELPADCIPSPVVETAMYSVDGRFIGMRGFLGDPPYPWHEGDAA